METKLRETVALPTEVVEASTMRRSNPYKHARR